MAQDELEHDGVLSFVKPKFIVDMNDELAKPFTAKEVERRLYPHTQ